MARFVFEDAAPAAASAAPAGRFVFEDEPVPATVGRGESFVRGAVQSATVNLSDELVGKTAEAGARLRAQTDASLPLVVPGPRALAKTYPGLPYPEAQARWRQGELARRGYADLDAAAQGQNRAFLDPAHAARGREVRDAERARNDAAYEANPGSYVLGSVVGSAPVAIATGGAGATRQGAGLGARVLAGAKAAAPVGAAYGAGGSEADSVGGVVRDAAVGGAGAALLAGAVPVAGAAVRRVLSPIARKGAAMVTKGTQRAQQQAAEESAQAVASLEGAARERAANAYRQMERIELAIKNPATPRAERAALEAFKKSPEYAALVEANARGILAVAPGAAAEREAAAVIAEQARQGLPQAIQSRTTELLTPQARADAASFLKAYAEPAVWALGAQQAASALGMEPGTQAILAGAAGMIGGRTRAGKALANRLTRPAHQVAVGNALRRIGSPPPVPPSATQTAAIGLDSELAALLNAWRGRPGFAPAAAAEEDQ
jgi:hypothetical protein